MGISGLVPSLTHLITLPCHGTAGRCRISQRFEPLRNAVTAECSRPDIAREHWQRHENDKLRRNRASA